MRRDFTINSLFYNINSGQVGRLTGSQGQGGVGLFYNSGRWGRWPGGGEISLVVSSASAPFTPCRWRI